MFHFRKGFFVCVLNPLFFESFCRWKLGLILDDPLLNENSLTCLYFNLDECKRMISTQKKNRRVRKMQHKI